MIDGYHHLEATDKEFFTLEELYVKWSREWRAETNESGLHQWWFPAYLVDPRASEELVGLHDEILQLLSTALTPEWSELHESRHTTQMVVVREKDLRSASRKGVVYIRPSDFIDGKAVELRVMGFSPRGFPLRK